MTSPQDKGRKYEKIMGKDEIPRPMSGAGFLKEDKKSPDYLIQVKYTEAASYSIKLKDLENLERNATLEDREPKFELGFKTNGRMKEYVLVPKRVWECLTS